MFHVTERLLLRPFWPEDWTDVHAALSDGKIVRNLARAPWPYREADARYFVEMPQDQYLPHFAIIESASGALVGSAGFGECEGETEIGYWLARKVWGNGYASEAARALVRIARTLGHRRLVAGHFIDNPASGRVLIIAGFVPTGQIRQRQSLARGGMVASVEHALDLDQVDTVPPLAA